MKTNLIARAEQLAARLPHLVTNGKSGGRHDA